jgi:Anti-sigma-28 factor, FlgM
MNKDREDKMGHLKQQIEAGEYRVDPTAVADAIVRRLRDVAAARGEIVRQTEHAERADGKHGQNKCSYPTSSPSASVNTTPAGPSTTDPITVRSNPRRSWFDAVFAGFLHTLAGTQAHSS